jgi:uncharacterized membrane protein YhfC
MKHRHTCFLLILLASLAGPPRQTAAADACLLFACDGGEGEQRVLFEQSATWIINSNRAVAPSLGRLIYRVPIGEAALERLSLVVNSVPHLVEFSADGRRWETLVSFPGTGTAAKSDKFIAEDVGFTATQRQTVRTSAFAWFRLQATGKTSLETLQLRRFRLDVSAATLPLQFVRVSWWRELAPHAQGPLMVMVGVLSIALVWCRWRVSWRAWAGGAALWIASVALKFAWAGLTMSPANRLLHAVLPQMWANLAYWCYGGLLTGVFECGIFLLVASVIKRGPWTWRQALSLGVGFGAIEAIVVGLAAILLTSRSGPWQHPATWPEATAPVFERFLAIIMHTAAAAMVLRALLSGKWGWFAASFAYKSATDALAMWLNQGGLGLFSSLWLVEWLCVAPFAIVGLLALVKLKGDAIWSNPMAAPSPVQLTTSFPNPTTRPGVH